MQKEQNKMSGVNQITIVGNVGSAPELSHGHNNASFCQFSVAVNEQWKTDGEKRPRVTWFPVIAFNGLSEACATYVQTGRLLAIQGRVQSREYEDKSGTRHQVMQVVAEKVTFLGTGNRDQNNRRPSAGQPAAASREHSVPLEDAPF
jgi:single-strand DNA-binding protein